MVQTIADSFSLSTTSPLLTFLLQICNVHTNYIVSSKWDHCICILIFRFVCMYVIIQILNQKMAISLLRYCRFKMCIWWYKAWPYYEMQSLLGVISFSGGGGGPGKLTLFDHLRTTVFQNWTNNINVSTVLLNYHERKSVALNTGDLDLLKDNLAFY